MKAVSGPATRTTQSKQGAEKSKRLVTAVSACHIIDVIFAGIPGQSHSKDPRPLLDHMHVGIPREESLCYTVGGYGPTCLLHGTGPTIGRQTSGYDTGDLGRLSRH